MGINEQSQKLMDKIRAKKGKPLFLNTVEAVREANIKQYCTNPPLVEIGRTEDQFVPCPWGTLRIKLYYPKDTGDAGLLPVVVFYHGGGWTVDTVETHDKAVHVMCAASGCVFASVDYRLAPEHKFPAGIEDAYTGLQWVYDNAEQIGVDRNRIAVCGDSSGGNFAAVMCQLARDRNGVPIQKQVLIYPNTDFVMAGWESVQTVGSGYTARRTLCCGIGTTMWAIPMTWKIPTSARCGPSLSKIFRMLMWSWPPMTHCMMRARHTPGHWSKQERMSYFVTAPT